MLVVCVESVAAIRIFILSAYCAEELRLAQVEQHELSCWCDLITFSLPCTLRARYLAILSILSTHCHRL